MTTAKEVRGGDSDSSAGVDGLWQAMMRENQLRQMSATGAGSGGDGGEFGGLGEGGGSWRSWTQQGNLVSICFYAFIILF